MVGGAEGVGLVVLVSSFGGSGFLGVGDPLKVIITSCDRASRGSMEMELPLSL